MRQIPHRRMFAAMIGAEVGIGRVLRVVHDQVSLAAIADQSSVTEATEIRAKVTEQAFFSVLSA